MSEPQSSPADVVQRQLEAYNGRDLEAFLATFHDEAKDFGLGAEAPSFAGKPAIGQRYQELFDRSPELHSVVVNRTVFGRAVIDLERITGRNGSPEPLDLLAIYEVLNGLIVRVHFVWP